MKIEAVKAAKGKAESLAGAINQSIGKALHIQELNDYRPMQGKISGISNTIQIRGNSSLYGSQATEPIIEFGKLYLEYSIVAKFSLE